jgi:hypothetical protein
MLYQVLFTTTPTQILGNIKEHKMYMHINIQDGSYSKKKDLGLKAKMRRKAKQKNKLLGHVWEQGDWRG